MSTGQRYNAYDVLIDYERETRRLRDQDDRDLEDERGQDDRYAWLLADDGDDWWLP